MSELARSASDKWGFSGSHRVDAEEALSSSTIGKQPGLADLISTSLKSEDDLPSLLKFHSSAIGSESKFGESESNSTFGGPKYRWVAESVAHALAPKTELKTPSTRPVFYPIQEWEGHVRSVGPNSIIAQLTTISGPQEGEDVEAEIPLAEIDDSDLPKVLAGRVFRWVIGYQRIPSGKRRISQIVFRDLPAWTRQDMERADESAQKLLQAINSANGQQQSAAE